MKMIGKLAAGAFVAIAFMVWQDGRENPDENRMESVHARADIHRVDCTKTEDLAGHDWLACRWGDNGDWGSIWVQREDEEGPIWLSQNGKAMQVVERYNSLPREDQSQAIRLRQTTLEDSADPEFSRLPSVPWDNLK